MQEAGPPTQQFVDIQSIRDGVVFLKNGGMRKILMVSGVNFDLKSEAEQGLILNMFQGFLNTLDFPVQFFIHSRKVNVDTYLERMRVREQEEVNELLKIQIQEYIEFIKTFIEQNSIISKTFFIIIPYTPHTVQLQHAGSSMISGVFTVFHKKNAEEAKQYAKTKVREQETSVQENLKQLTHRVNQIVDSLTQIGLRTIPLDDEELTELFYNLYNPQLTERKGLAISGSSR